MQGMTQQNDFSRLALHDLNDILDCAAHTVPPERMSVRNAMLAEDLQADEQRLIALEVALRDTLGRLEVVQSAKGAVETGAPTNTANSNCGPLSHRQVEILSWVAQGKSNNVIATILGISAHTVDTHLRRAFERLETSDRTVAAIRAVQNGWIAAAA